MITIISILLTIYQVSLVTSDCPADPSGDERTNACKDSATLFDSTQIQCDAFGCCSCTSIQCGGEPDADGNIEYCEELTASDLNAAFEVKTIEIYGDPDNGAKMECNGKSSCEATGITGGKGDGNVKSAKCSGDRACAEAIFNFDCLPPPHSQCKVECLGFKSCYSVGFTINNTAGLLCDGTEACYDGVFMFESNVGGSVECKGERVCAGEETSITFNDTKAVICDGPSACEDATITVHNPREDFVLKCSGEESCANLKLALIYEDLEGRDVSTIKGFDCDDDSACSDADITVTNNQAIPLVIEELNCGQEDSCLNIEFIFDGSQSVSTTFEKCVCGEYGGCEGAMGIESCWYNIEKMECKGEGGCEGQERTITNPTDDFELLCTDYRSCADFTLTININDKAHSSIDNLESVVTDFKGVKCTGKKSCVGIKVEFINHDTDVTLIVGNIDCSGDDSCTTSESSRGAQFITTGASKIGDVMIEEVECGVHEVCDENGDCADVNNCGESSKDCSVDADWCNDRKV